jgi:alpha-L-fucosidase
MPHAAKSPVSDTNFSEEPGFTSWGSAVFQWTYANNSNLQWSIVPAGGGWYYIQNRTSGLVLDGRGLFYNGAALGQWGMGNSSNLQWQFN